MLRGVWRAEWDPHQLLPHSPSTAPLHETWSSLAPAGPSPTEAKLKSSSLWLCHEPISTTASSSIHLVPAGHTSGQWGSLAGTGRARAAVGFVGVHGGRAGPELLPASMAGPGAQPLISEDLHWWLCEHSTWQPPRLPACTPTKDGIPHRHTPRQRVIKMSEVKGMSKGSKRKTKDSLQENPHKAASGFLSKIIAS